MESILAVALIESFLITAATELEGRRRRKILIKWMTGNITLDEIKLLKKQVWFSKQFKQVVVASEKKND